MSTPKTTTSYLKLSVPGNRNGDNWHIDEQENALVEFLKKVEINSSVDGERIKVSVDHEDPFYETTFRIQAKNGFYSNILQHTSDFVCSMKSQYGSLAGTIVLNHLALFKQKLVCDERNIKTERISFGNFFGTNYINHFDVYFPPDSKCCKRKYKTQHNGSKNDYIDMNSIKTTFDFDRSLPVTCEFTTEEFLPRLIEDKENTNSENTSEKNAEPELQLAQVRYQLSIDGGAIRQIIVDPNHRGDDLHRIYFVLKYAAVVKRTVTWKNESMKPQRVLQLPYGVTGHKSTKEVLTENKIFCLDFNKQELDLLYTIVSRLRCRWNTPVEVVRIQEINRLIKGVDQNGRILGVIPLITELLLYDGSSEKTTYFTDNFYKDNQVRFWKALDYWFPLPKNDYKTVEGQRNYKKIHRRIEERRFAYTYLIEALLSRGSVVKDHLLLDKDTWVEFLQIISEHVNDDNDDSTDFYHRNVLCEAALEDLLIYVDSRTRDGDLLVVFKRLCMARRESRVSNEISKDSWDQGYRKIRKVVLTPTRKIFMAPEIIMSNRAINGEDHDGTRIIRVNFRDDNFQKMRFNNLRDLLGSSVHGHLESGFQIMGRYFSYLASSNSQMRDSGAYFMERFNKRELNEHLEKHSRGEPEDGFKPKILKCRNKLGKFEETGSIPKAMARLGQCFTQARRCEGVEIGHSDYTLIPDVCGGKNDEGAAYMFTDGVGMLSMELARQLCQSIGIPSVCSPATFQIRFLGFKGMLSIDPGIDDKAKQFRIAYRKRQIPNISNEDEDLAPYLFQCLFRDSQKKFDCRSLKKNEKWPIEMVKWSTPTAVTLNKPFINILDQVSALQSLGCHQRICNRIESLLDTELDTFSKCIVNESDCRSRLEGMPRRVHFDSLKRINGFDLSKEPFFRTLIRASIDSSMNRLLRKVQIPIPPNLGRTMFGVTDETGQLQYGQIFVRYTANVNNKHPARNSGNTLTGKVLVTKFPSMCEGDVRMYEAVDIPELHHLTDVIVFPQSGPRSQPDEMAGSDLDGDEYAVIWDPLLFFERNEEAFAYCGDKPPTKFTLEEMDAKMNDFYVEFMQQEDVGVTSINHLVQSDLYGITAPVCNELVKKNAMTLDFSKSGKAPAPLTNEGRVDPDTGLWHPPERSERRPEFAQSCHNGSASYASSRLLGTLYRELRSINDVVMSSSEKQAPVVIDELLVWEGWERHVAKAKSQMQKYNGQLRSIMDTFGVGTEAEVFSGCYREIRNRYSEKEQDDLSMFSTEAVIETQMTELYQKFRKEFFEEFVEHRNGMPPAYMQCTKPENERRSDEEKDVLRRVCRDPSNGMMAKAVAYYRTCYEIASKSEERKLSFAWIAYDILNIVRGNNLMNMETVPTTRLPQFQAICDHRNEFIENDRTEQISKLSQFNRRMYVHLMHNQHLLDKQEHQAIQIILNYCMENMNLQKCLVIIDSWARAKGLLYDNKDLESMVDSKEKDKAYHNASLSSLKWYHLALLVIMVATNKLGSLLDEKQGHAGSKIFEEVDSSSDNIPNSRLSDPDLDRLTLSFFRFLSTREFRRLRVLNFKPIGLSSIFMRGEWLPYHVAATQTYYNILLNLRFDELPVASESVTKKQSIVREAAPFIVELPAGFEKDLFLNKLRENSKCTEIQGRIDKLSFKKNDYSRLIISCRGTTEAINELKDFTTLKLPRHQSSQESNMSDALSHLLYYNVMGEKLLAKKKLRTQSAQNLGGGPKKSGMNERQRSGPNVFKNYRNSPPGPRTFNNGFNGQSNVNQHHRSF